MRFLAVAVAALAFLIPAAPAAAETQVGLPQACDVSKRIDYKDFRTLVTIDLDTAADKDVRILGDQILAEGRAESLLLIPKETQDALNGTPADLRTFLKARMAVRWAVDLRIRVNQTMAQGGTNVRDAGQKVLDADAVEAHRPFLNEAQYAAREQDYRDLTQTAQSNGGPEVRKAATTALSGSFEDVRAFLCSGWQAAKDKDDAPSASPSVSVSVSASAGGALPTTGSNTGIIALGGVALIAIGSGAVLLARRRRV